MGTHIIDGTNLIVGRAASHIAQLLLRGEEVQLVHAEKMVLVGNPKSFIEKYQTRRRLQHKGTPEFSPVWPKVPHLLVRRIIRGMLPWKKARGKAAFKRLRVFRGAANLSNAISLEHATFNKQARSITIDTLCRQLGFNG